MIMRFVFVLFLFYGLAHAQEKNTERARVIEDITKEISSNKEIQLDALEIRAKIYEPNVIYILDRTRLDLDFEEEKVLFTPRMDDPIVFDEF